MHQLAKHIARVASDAAKAGELKSHLKFLLSEVPRPEHVCLHTPIRPYNLRLYSL